MFDHVTKYTIMHIHKGANQNAKILFFFLLTSLLVLLISITNVLLCFGLISLAFVLES